jgi:hypothetical protein
VHSSRPELRNPARSLFFALAVLLVAQQSAIAQQACPPVRIAAPNPRDDIFSDRQEMDLGDAIAEQVQQDFLVIDDEDYTAYLQGIGKRLLKNAPPSELQVQFFLFDLPIANAISLPGGRVYVSRKLVALARNEDELAGVLAHELGHVLTHQPAIHVSQLFRDAIGITQPGTREEIFKNYEQLQDSVVRKHKPFSRGGGEDKQDQLIADQIGLQLVANAGYAVQSFPEIFDRIAETKGKTGNWFSDMFGATSDESRRLREILKQTPALNCGAGSTSTNREEFQKWKSSVISYTGLGHKEHLTDVITKLSLNPPLQSDIRKIRFSPDGKYLFAQNESTIFVMTAESLSSKFTIYAPGAYDAEFSPNSQSIVFYNPKFRVESWSVADASMNSASEVVISRGCFQSLLSSDGKYLACYGRECDLSLYDVEANSQVFQKKNFYELTFRDYFLMIFSRLLGEANPQFLHMRFSPDARYLVAHSSRDESLALSLDGFKPVPLPGSLRALLSADFTFIGPDRIAGLDPYNPKNAGVMKFPGGEWVQKLELGNQSLESGTNPRYLFLRPIRERALGIMDLQTGRIVSASERSAVDVLGDNYVRERTDGDIGMFSLTNKNEEVRRTKLPLGQLGELQAFAVSPDLHWLAISGKSRGAVWDLLRNQRAFYVRGFGGAVVNEDGIVDADIAKFEETTRHLVRLDPAAKRVDAGMDLDKVEATQFGSVLLRTTHNGKDDWKPRNVLIEALDVRSGAVLWSRTFPKEAPEIASRRKEGNLVLSWPAPSDGAKLEIHGNPMLSQRWPKIEVDTGDYFLEVLEPRTGKLLGATILRTGKGSFEIGSVESAGNWLVAADSSNRLHVISVESGEPKGLLFGRRPAISPVANLLTAENERGQLSLYDLGTMARRERYVFSKPITYVHFGADNRRLLVLTGDQTAYFLKLPKSEISAVRQ